MRNKESIIDQVPFLRLGIVILFILFVVADFVSAIAWFLKLLEITSVFDRILPNWTTIHFFMASIILTVSTKLLSKVFPN